MRRDHLLVFQDDLVVGVVHGLSDSVVGVGGQDVVQGGPKREDRLHGFRLGGRDQVENSCNACSRKNKTNHDDDDAKLETFVKVLDHITGL
jgi:hypothetical protein